MFTLIRAIAWSALFIGFVGVFMPAQVLQWAGVSGPSSIGAQQVAGEIVVLLGLAIAFSCIATFVIVGRGTPAPFDPPRRLVTSGPYQFVRNPMYWGAGLALCGAGLFYRSLALVGYALAFFVVLDQFIRWYEEPTLRRLFGAEYEAYCSRVRRWWPVPRRAQ